MKVVLLGVVLAFIGCVSPLTPEQQKRFNDKMASSIDPKILGEEVEGRVPNARYY